MDGSDTDTCRSLASRSLFAARCIRRVLPSSLLAVAACSGDIEHLGPEVAPAASGLWCATSFGCPEGERCDDSACVADATCPPAREARLLHQAAAGDPFFGCVGTLRSGDSEYFEGCGVAGDIRFVDLRRGGTSSLQSKRGAGSCSGDPTHCLLSAEGAQTLLLGVARGDGAWGVERVLSGLAPFTVPDAVDLAAGRVLQQRPESVGFVDVATGDYHPWVQLEGRASPQVVWDWGGVGRVVVASAGAAGAASAVSLAPLEAGGMFRTVLEAPVDAGDARVVMPTPDGWLIAAGDAGAPAGVTVWRVTGDGTERVGAVQGSAVAVAMAHQHAGRPRLEDGHIAYALECDAQGDRCQSSRVDFADLAVETLGEVRIEGARGLVGQQYRALACGAVEALVEERVVSAAAEVTDKRYWLVRVPGDGG